MFDIYDSPDVHFIADGHKIPVMDEAFDLVVVQAVLEHVLEPQIVVDEIWRVLKPKGVVMAGTPFMQPVHEGPYDFTRFTASGHRWLFRRFVEIESSTSGVGASLLWAIDYFTRSLFRSRWAGKVAKLLFFWLRWFDRWIPPSHASDAAGFCSFVGRKSDNAISPKEIIAYYKGADNR